MMCGTEIDSENNVKYEEAVDNCPSTNSLPSQEEKKLKLKIIQDRLLIQEKAEFCKDVDEKDKTIHALNKELKKITAQTQKANVEHKKLIGKLNENCREVKKIGKQDEKSTNYFKELAKFGDKNGSINKRLGLLGNEMRTLEMTITKMKTLEDELQYLKKNTSTFVLSPVDKCIKDIEDSPLMQNILSKKKETGEKLQKITKEKTDLVKRKAQFLKYIERSKEKLKSIKAFTDKFIDADKTLEMDRIEMQRARNDLIRKGVNVDNLRYDVDKTKLCVNEMHRSVDERRTLINEYIKKTEEIKKLMDEQNNSIVAMKCQYKQDMRDLNEDVEALKANTVKELNDLIPVIEEIKVTQRKLKEKETLFSLTKNTHNIMKTELQDVKNQIDTLNDEIHFIEKKICYDVEPIAKKVEVLESDIEVQYHNYYNLKETVQKLKFDINCGNVSLKEKKKEVFNLENLEYDLRLQLADLYDGVGVCDAGYETTGAYLNKQMELVEAELKYLGKGAERCKGDSRHDDCGDVTLSGGNCLDKGSLTNFLHKNHSQKL